MKTSFVKDDWMGGDISISAHFDSQAFQCGRAMSFSELSNH